jgi:hypothetical protein
MGVSEASASCHTTLDPSALCRIVLRGTTVLDLALVLFYAARLTWVLTVGCRR